MMVRWISLAPPGMVHSQEPMKSRARKLEGLIEFTIGITDFDNIIETVFVQNRIGLFGRAHVHQCETGPLKLYRSPLGADVRQGLATERAAEMPQKYEEHREFVGQFRQIVTIVADLLTQNRFDIHWSGKTLCSIVPRSDGGHYLSLF